MANHNNIILIGMPTAGKSTLGVVLAKTLGYDYIDTDLLIQHRTGQRLEEIIRQQGDRAFLDLEGDVCASLKAEHAVIATGGSVIYRSHAMENLQTIGTVVYLKISLGTLKARLKDAQSRGVVLKKGQTLDSLYLERTALYEHYADLTVFESDMSFEETLQMLLEVLFDRHAGTDLSPETGTEKTTGG